MSIFSEKSLPYLRANIPKIMYQMKSFLFFFDGYMFNVWTLNAI